MNIDFLAITQSIYDDAIAKSDSWHHYIIKWLLQSGFISGGIATEKMLITNKL